MDTTNKLAEEQERARFEAVAKEQGLTPGDFKLGAYLGWLLAKKDAAQATQAVSEPVATQPAEAVAWRWRILPPGDAPTWATNGDPEKRWVVCANGCKPPVQPREATQHEDGFEIQALGVITNPAPASASESEPGEPAPPHNLPNYDECSLRVHNSDFIAKRVAEGGYGAEPDSMLATQLHRFIYEYDDADPYRSAWFMHRLDLLVNELRSERASASVAGAGEALEPGELPSFESWWQSWPFSAYKDPRTKGVAHHAYRAGKAAEGEARSYTDAIGAAGEAYMRRFEHAHSLPAQFRWEELWNAMASATCCEYPNCNGDAPSDGGCCAALARQVPAPLSQAVPEGFWLAPMEPDTPMALAVINGGAGVHMAVNGVPQFLLMRDSWLSRHPQPQAADLTDEQWYDLASAHVTADWNGPGFLDLIKAVGRAARAAK